MKEIPLSGKYGAGYVALVDDDDYELVSQYRWRGHAHMSRSGELLARYAITGGNSQRLGGPKAVLMHRLLCPVSDGISVDHVNGNRLDNRRQNLRPATHIEQAWNSAPRRDRRYSRYKGVRFKSGKRRKRWAARIKVHGRDVSLGHFWTEYEAARAYDAAALRYFGEFARLNFPRFVIASEAEEW